MNTHEFSYIVSISDINYGGHVSNAAVLNFFQEARIQYLSSMGMFSEIDIGDNTGLILVESHIKYLAEMFHQNILHIHTWITDIKRSSFCFRYLIKRDAVSTIEGWTTMLGFDYTKRKVKKLPETFKTLIS